MIEEDVRISSAAGGRHGTGAIAESLYTNLQTRGRGEYRGLSQDLERLLFKAKAG